MKECDQPLGAARCTACPRTKRRVRIALALFATTNFCAGLATSMLLLCSSSHTHRQEPANSLNSVTLLHREHVKACCSTAF